MDADNPLLWVGISSLTLLASHMGLAAAPVRGRLVALLGLKVYLGVYSLAAVAALGWMVVSYQQAPHIRLWQVSAFRWLPLVLMPCSLVLIVLGNITPGPTAILLKEHPKKSWTPFGIQRITRHPSLWGIALWALAHLLAAGTPAGVLFFGGFFLLAVAGSVHIDRRRKLHLAAQWPAFSAQTSNIPFAAILAGRTRLIPGELSLPAIAGALMLYGLLVGFHPLLLGAPAF